MENGEELVDIVDENDEALYRTTKAEAHEKGLLHRTVISEIKDSEGRWVLIRQASDKQDAGQYVSAVGGHVMAGETEDDALKREAEEECGLADFDFALIGKVIFRRAVNGRDENHYFILYEIYSDKEVVLNAESVEAKKFSDEELKESLKKNPELFGVAFHFVVQTFYPHLLTESLSR